LKNSIIAEFDTRRAAELAVEHVVQDCGIQRTNVFVQPTGDANTSGTRKAGADAKSAPAPEQGEKLEGPIEVSVDCPDADLKRIEGALRSAGAHAVQSK